jgi:DNA-binding transcriptional LysR family regulator
MEIRHLRTFQAVADQLSFHRAAESLHYAQSTVSAHIQGLEEELGLRLFERLGRRILLTEAGEGLLNYAHKILDLEEEAQAELRPQNQTQGSLHIRVPESFCITHMPRVIARFRALLPQVRLRFITCSHDGLKEDLRKGITDLAFLLTESIQAADLEAEVLGTEQVVLISAPSHRLAGLDRVQTQDLAGETLLLSRVDCSYRRSLERILAEEKTEPAMVLEFHSVAAIKESVSQDLGITAIPLSAIEKELAQNTLKVLAWTESPLEVASLMVWHRDKWLSPSLRLFMETTRGIFGSGSG